MKKCGHVDPKTGKKCALPAGHRETGPIKAHMDEGKKIPGGINGAQGMMYNAWHEEEKKDD